MVDISIRFASLDDAAAIAAFHVRVWRHTYRDLAPAAAYDALDEPHRLARWMEKLSDDDPDQIVLLAESGGELQGLGAAGAPSDALFGGRGEIRYLYVDPAIQRRGIGRRLLSGLAAHLKARQYPGAGLSVVEGNDPAMAFYEALHGRRVGEFIDPGPIWRSRNIVYVWDDMAKLI